MRILPLSFLEDFSNKYIADLNNDPPAANGAMPQILDDKVDFSEINDYVTQDKLAKQSMDPVAKKQQAEQRKAETS